LFDRPPFPFFLTPLLRTSKHAQEEKEETREKIEEEDREAKKGQQEK